MNPLYNALTGTQNGLFQPPAPQMNNVPSAPGNGLQGLLERAKSMMQNPQQALRQFLPGLPEQIANDPNQIINWLQQTGRISPQQIQTAQQLQQMLPR